MKVFLGGTANKSDWRKTIIDSIKMDYFNPIVENWDEKAKQKEIEERETCDWLLYVITPKMMGVYSIAEVVYDSCNRPHKTIFCVLEEDGEEKFNKQQLSSLESTKELVKLSGATVLDDLNNTIEFLNFVKDKDISF